MDVCAENRGRPHQNVRFPGALVVGRNFLTPQHPGVRVRNILGKSGCCLSSLSFGRGVSPDSQNRTPCYKSGCLESQHKGHFCGACRSAAVKVSPEIVHESCHGKCREISGEISLLLVPQETQGGENPVFGKPWFCLRDTRHFRHFRRFPGSEERNPLFLWVECKSSFSPFFVKTTCFR